MYFENREAKKDHAAGHIRRWFTISQPGRIARPMNLSGARMTAPNLNHLAQCDGHRPASPDQPPGIGASAHDKSSVVDRAA